MNRLNKSIESMGRVATFVQAAESLSFVGASRILGVSASAVGKTIAALEQALGVRLFQRSTRTVRLTTEGELFYERCRKVLDELHDAESMLSQSAELPRGRLRVSLPTIGYRFLVPHLAEFQRLYPQIELDLDFKRSAGRYHRGWLRRGDPQWRSTGFATDVQAPRPISLRALRGAEIPCATWRAKKNRGPGRSRMSAVSFSHQRKNSRLAVSG